MKVLVKHDAIPCGELACANLLSGLLVLVLDTELGTLPEMDLMLKMDQNRLGLISKVLPKEWKYDSLLPWIAFST